MLHCHCQPQRSVQLNITFEFAMTKHIYTDIKELLQVRNPSSSPLIGPEFKEVPRIKNAFLVLEDHCVVDFGSMDMFDASFHKDATVESLEGRFVLPAFCDSHTHSVFAKAREGEFVDKINGLSYQEIASKGGGILNSAKSVEATSEEALFNTSLERVKLIIKGGTGALEIKSGYGLSLTNELKLLKVIQQIKKQVDIPIQTTFLAAHAIPLEFKGRKAEYVREITSNWIPAVVNDGLADYIDLFCETGYFDANDISEIANAIKGTPLKLKVHVNQFTSIGGIEVAINHGAVSVDHLEVLEDKDVEALKQGKTIATLLPACSFYLNIPYAPAKRLIQEGIPIALASDFNPGSSPTSNMFFVWSLACIYMKLTPEEALNALTVNGAFAMGLNESNGCIFRGYKGKMIVSEKAPSLAYFPYAFAANHMYKMIN